MFIEPKHPTNLKLRSRNLLTAGEHCAPSELNCLFGFFGYKHFVPPGLKKDRRTDSAIYYANLETGQAGSLSY
jgi:hypothetical protein